MVSLEMCLLTNWNFEQIHGDWAANLGFNAIWVSLVPKCWRVKRVIREIS